MKLICDQCGAKYSIADEKVRGKVFKIRCKKCQNVIVVRGTEQPTAEGGQAIAASDSPAAPAEPEPIWYVVIGREQVGPLTDGDLEGRLKSGEVSGESFVWQEGFSDWVQLNTVDRFSSLTAAPAAAPVAGNGAAAPASADAGGLGDLAGSANSEMDDEATQAVSTDSIPGYAEHQAAAAAAAAAPAELREEATAVVNSAAAQEQAADAGLAAAGAGVGAAEVAAATGGMAAAGAFGDGGMTLEEGPAAAPFDAGGQLASDMAGSISAGSGNDLMSSAPAEADAGGGMFSAFDQPPPEGANGDPAMVGARNENSVLFSLKNLQSLAMGQDSGAGGAVAPSTEALSDASGLIDVRALAGSMPGSGAEAGEMADDGMPLAPAAPVMIPMVRKRSNTPLILGAVFGGFLILGLSGIVITLLLRDGSSDKKSAPGKTAVVTVVATKAKKKDDGGEKDIGAIASKAEEPEAKASEKGKSPKNTAKKESAKKEATKREAAPAKVSGGSKSSSARKAPPKASPRKATRKAARKPARPAPKSKSGDQDIDDLLSGSSVAKKPRKDPRKASGSRKTPKPSAGKGKLDKRAIQKVVRANGPRISGCATRIPGPPGQKVKIAMRWQIQPNGRVAQASVLTAKFKSHSVGRCVLSAVKAMRFPSFDGKPIKIGKYPFNLKKK